jgi:hypothetical protein
MVKSLRRFLNKTTEGTEHFFGSESRNLLQRVENGMDILILSQVSQLFTDEKIPGEKPPFVWLIETDMVIGMAGCRDH